MNNILVDELPGAVSVDGAEYEIRTDFRTCLRVILAFEDEELTDYEKQAVLLQNLYPVIPENLEAAAMQGCKFLDGGKGGTGKSEEEEPRRLYSFGKDAAFIFAAFRQTHQIDLERESLHWWKFLALFLDLGSETAFCNLVGLRKRLMTGKATKEEKAEWQNSDLVNIPQPDLRTAEEKEKERVFNLALSQGKT